MIEQKFVWLFGLRSVSSCLRNFFEGLSLFVVLMLFTELFLPVASQLEARWTWLRFGFCVICSISLSCKRSNVSSRGDRFCIFLVRRLRFQFLWLLCMDLPILSLIFLLPVPLFCRIPSKGLGHLRGRRGFFYVGVVITCRGLLVIFCTHTAVFSRRSSIMSNWWINSS